MQRFHHNFGLLLKSSYEEKRKNQYNIKNVNVFYVLKYVVIIVLRNNEIVTT